jgi:hypothetical protein
MEPEKYSSHHMKAGLLKVLRTNPVLSSADDVRMR